MQQFKPSIQQFECLKSIQASWTFFLWFSPGLGYCPLHIIITFIIHLPHKVHNAFIGIPIWVILWFSVSTTKIYYTKIIIYRTKTTDMTYNTYLIFCVANVNASAVKYKYHSSQCIIIYECMLYYCAKHIIWWPRTALTVCMGHVSLGITDDAIIDHTWDWKCT